MPQQLPVRGGRHHHHRGEGLPRVGPYKEDTLDRSKDLIRLAVDAVLDKKGIEPIVLDVSEFLQIVDHFVIASGANRRQVATLVEAVHEKLRDAGFRPLRTEGRHDAEWVLLDYGDVVLHIFLDEVRRIYDLERLWVDAPRLTVARA